MEAYVERIKHDAENLAKEVFPKKALELDELVNVNCFSFLYLIWDFWNLNKLFELKNKMLDTKALSSVFEEKDFPKAEEFVNIANSFDKENLEDLAVKI